MVVSWGCFGNASQKSWPLLLGADKPERYLEIPCKKPTQPCSIAICIEPGTKHSEIVEDEHTVTSSTPLQQQSRQPYPHGHSIPYLLLLINLKSSKCSKTERSERIQWIPSTWTLPQSTDNELTESNSLSLSRYQRYSNHISQRGCAG